MLSPTNLILATVLVAEGSPKCPGKLFWNGSKGLVYGDGYKALADDFPPGTRLIVTARIELPQQPAPGE